MATIRPAPTGGSDTKAALLQTANAANQAAKRANACLPKDGSEAMTGALSGTSASFSGSVSAASAAISGNETVGGNLTVTGTATIGGNAPVTQSGAVTAGNLATWNTNGVIQDAGVTPNHAGRVAQVVNFETGAVATGTTLLPWDDTIPQNTEGDQYMSLSITPQNASSTLLIDVIAYWSASAGVRMTMALFQDSGANALAAIGNTPNAAADDRLTVLRHKMTAGGTSATTFKVRIGPNSAATITFNGNAGARKYGGVACSSITITEILP